jgi:hypothetical protein
LATSVGASRPVSRRINPWIDCPVSASRCESLDLDKELAVSLFEFPNDRSNRSHYCAHGES